MPGRRLDIYGQVVFAVFVITSK